MIESRCIALCGNVCGVLLSHNTRVERSTSLMKITVLGALAPRRYIVEFLPAGCGTTRTPEYLLFLPFYSFERSACEVRSTSTFKRKELSF